MSPGATGCPSKRIIPAIPLIIGRYINWSISYLRLRLYRVKSRTGANLFNRIDMLKKSSLYVVNLLILVGLGVGCRQDATDPGPSDATYFPLQTGNYWIYQVTQETYSLISAPTKRIYQVQEKVGNSFTQNGQLFFLVEESVKLATQSEWKINAIRTVYKNSSEVVSQDNNVPTLRLVFPVTATTFWNVNTYNANPDTVLRYQDTGRSFRIGNQVFDRTISVVGSNDSTLVNLQKYQRVYAQNVGLVYRESASLAYCQSSPDCIGKGIIASGSREKWELMTGSYLK